MLSVNDILDSGIVIEGKVKVQSWGNDDEPTVLFETDDFDAENRKLQHSVSCKEVINMFANDGILTLEVVE